ncbi:hypothetical protein N665_0006s0159 [Sinapis alba]|nr:hypothetical protein N665_0006s0159 [Sinapis alba]
MRGEGEKWSFGDACLLVIIGSISFFGFVFAAVVSKLFPLSDNLMIQAIEKDSPNQNNVILYPIDLDSLYCFLASLTLPTLLVDVYFHWLSMKLFKYT